MAVTRIGVVFHQAVFLSSGIKQLRFKPAYNPYTEPSMEVFSYHEGKQNLDPVVWCGVLWLTCADTSAETLRYIGNVLNCATSGA